MKSLMQVKKRTGGALIGIFKTIVGRVKRGHSLHHNLRLLAGAEINQPGEGPTLDDFGSSLTRKRIGVLVGSSTFEPLAIKAL